MLEDVEIVETKMAKFTNTDSANMILILPGVRNVIEDHLIWLRERSSTHKVDKLNAYRFDKDFSSYLTDLNIPVNYQWVYFRVNDYLHPWDFTEETEMLLFPNHEDIELLIAQYAAIIS